MKKVLFICESDSYARALQRYKALIDLGYKVDKLLFTRPKTVSRYASLPKQWKRIRNRLGYPADEAKINQKILDYLDRETPDLIWNEKGVMIKPSTLKFFKESFPKSKLVFYSEDDMFARHNNSKYFIAGLPLHDMVFTTKSFNCNQEELPSLGAKKTVFVEQCFDPGFHRPIQISEKERIKFGSNVSFIGTFEKERAETILFLAESQIDVRVWGSGWKGWVGKHPNLKVENKPIFNENYVKAICSTKINLGFLRKLNRDLHTSRTIEIPACGGFLLAERTVEHQNLFEENREAVFFDINDAEELLRKIRFYLQNEDQRQKIANAGRERCLNSGYSHQEKLGWMLRQIFPDEINSSINHP